MPINRDGLTVHNKGCTAINSQVVDGHIQIEKRIEPARYVNHRIIRCGRHAVVPVTGIVPVEILGIARPGGGRLGERPGALQTAAYYCG